jgi:glycosyltransferase involved in cell wall biosynthesis
MDSRNKITPQFFFSIVIPAHREEGYIEKTILSMAALDYPREKLEIIIVENGSDDRTADVIRASAPGWFKLLSCPEMGVSKAKNLGIEQISPQADWVVFLDADAFMEKGFLRELSEYLLKNESRNIGCGMVALMPDPDNRQARAWYRFYNFANRVVRTTRSIQVIRRDLLKDFRFDEALTFDEDTFMLRQCKTRSKYFFMKSNQVFSSIRRFEANGWFGQLFQWVSYASRSYEQKKHIQYKVLR